MTREDVLWLMARAMDKVAATYSPDRLAAEALDAALPLIQACIRERGMTEAMDVLAGRGPRRHAAQLAIRGLGGDD